MINKYKIGLFVAVLSLFAVVGTASASSLTWSVAQTLDLSSPDIDLTIASGSTAESIVVGTGSVTLSVVSGDSFVMSTASTGSFTITPTTYATKSCSSGVATVTITATGSETFTITPDASTCDLNSGGGSGGGGAAAPAVVVTPAVTTTTTTTATPVTSTTNTTPTTVTTTTYNFGTKTLKNGSKGEAVKELQRFLNQVLNLGLVVDGKLGPKTIKVIKQWQKDNGLVADGLIGAKTKAKMNASVQ